MLHALDLYGTCPERAARERTSSPLYCGKALACLPGPSRLLSAVTPNRYRGRLFGDGHIRFKIESFRVISAKIKGS